MSKDKVVEPFVGVEIVPREGRRKGNLRVRIHTGPGSVEPEHAGELDPNKIIVRAAGMQNIPPPPPEVKSQYWDTTKFPDFQTAHNLVLAGKAAFGRLPSSIRDEMRNDPANLERWLSDPRNRDVATRFGLLKPVEKSEAPPPVVPPPVAAAPPAAK